MLKEPIAGETAPQEPPERSTQEEKCISPLVSLQCPLVTEVNITPAGTGEIWAPVHRHRASIEEWLWS